jgi:hypothetical protein
MKYKSLYQEVKSENEKLKKGLTEIVDYGKLDASGRLNPTFIWVQAYHYEIINKAKSLLNLQ